MVVVWGIWEPNNSAAAAVGIGREEDEKMTKHCATTGYGRYAYERPGKVKAPLTYLFQLLEWAIAYWDIGIKSRTERRGPWAGTAVRINL
jgi:hypothetical protein